VRRRDGLVAILAAVLQAACAARAHPAVGVVVELNSADTLNAVAETHRRWHQELDAFTIADREHPPPMGGIVFVGSSTIRRWPHLAQDFGQASVPVILDRGFGGSTMAECSVLVPALVWRYRPKHVVVYAGDNDIAQGVPPLQVLDSFARFATAVRAELPETRITFVSVKPSPSREKWLPQIRETNNIVAAYLKTLANADYVDVFTPMLGPDGRPRPELFGADRLHMNDAGYALWQSLIGPRLASPPPPRPTP
jgi:lysophospholipase L1-like esterase